jgi:hypothetical protein
MSSRKRVKKFDIDLESDLTDYEILLNDSRVTIIEEMRAYDKSRGNKMLITVWWEESDVGSLDS